MAALGSEEDSLKADADGGHAELTFGDETCKRTLTRRNGTVVTDGDPYLDDPEIADLFAFLLETNEAPQAVARGDDPQELIMRPIVTAVIQDRIDQYGSKSGISTNSFRNWRISNSDSQRSRRSEQR